jgi:hypothetical protein
VNPDGEGGLFEMDEDPEGTNPMQQAEPQVDGGTDGGTRRLSSSTLRGWFTEAELTSCPCCATRSLVTVESGVSYCLECGHVPDGDPSGAPPRPAA